MADFKARWPAGASTYRGQGHLWAPWKR